MASRCSSGTWTAVPASGGRPVPYTTSRSPPIPSRAPKPSGRHDGSTCSARTHCNLIPTGGTPNVDSGNRRDGPLGPVSAVARGARRAGRPGGVRHLARERLRVRRRVDHSEQRARPRALEPAGDLADLLLAGVRRRARRISAAHHFPLRRAMGVGWRQALDFPRHQRRAPRRGLRFRPVPPAPFVGLAAAFGAVVFAVHPVHVEAVANGVGQAELTAAALVLGACLIHLARPRTIATSHRAIVGRLLRSVAVALLYVLAVLAKESAITLPGLLLILDVADGRVGRTPADWLRYGRSVLATFGLMAAAVIGCFALRASVLGSITAIDPTSEYPFLKGEHRVLNAW